MSYKLKNRLISLGLPLTIVLIFALVGYRQTHSLFALEPSLKNVSIYTDKTTYVEGQDVTLIIANNSNSPIALSNNCPEQPFQISELENDHWSSIEATTDKSHCVNAPLSYTVPAHRSLQTSYSYWPDLFSNPGVYRITATFEGNSGEVTTQFAVTQQ